MDNAQQFLNADNQAFFGKNYGFLPGQQNVKAQAAFWESQYVGQVQEAFAFAGAGSMQAQPTIAQCADRILNAVNTKCGTNFSASNLAQDPFLNGGAVNLIITGTNLPAAQFNSIQPSRSPDGILGAITGIGPSLHITGPARLDQSAVFSNSNIGGFNSVTFTAHIDSAYANNPIGALIHLIVDVLGADTRNPCP